MGIFYCKFRNFNKIRSDCTQTYQLWSNGNQNRTSSKCLDKSKHLIHNHQCHFKLMAPHWIRQMIQDCLPVSPYGNKNINLYLTVNSKKHQMNRKPNQYFNGQEIVELKYTTVGTLKLLPMTTCKSIGIIGCLIANLMLMYTELGLTYGTAQNKTTSPLKNTLQMCLTKVGLHSQNTGPQK